MKVQYKKATAHNVAADVLVVGLIADGKMSGVLAALDKSCDGFFAKLKKSGALPKRSGSVRTFFNVPNIKAKSVAVVAYDNHQKGLCAAGKAITGYLREHEVKKAAIHLIDNAFGGVEVQKKARLLTQNLLDGDYVCDAYKSERKDKSALAVSLLADSKTQAVVKQGIAEGEAIALGMKTLKDLGNAPGNVCTPKYLAQYAEQLAADYDNLSVEVHKESDIKALKMGALLSISKGSAEKPRLIKLQHKGSDDDPIIFVGKGVTFDTGGISLKPGAGMDEMKYDMCGAGAVMGLMKTIAELNLPINVIGIIPSVENMPSDRAIKPGDIVTSMSGKTIEILNTDAEGRMILCDALTYAQQFKPKALIDMATLTGAVIIALGRQPSGLMSNNDALADALLEAGEQSGDRAWRLPIWEEYVEQLKSPFADLQNIGGRDAGTITAGCFLGEFAKDVPWAHLDIAGTAWANRKDGATGRPVPLLAEYVLSQVKS